MIFRSTISNEEAAQLPAAHFDGEIVIVDNDEQIESVCKDLAAQRIIGFDTETRPSFKAGQMNRWPCCNYPHTGAATSYVYAA